MNNAAVNIHMCPHRTYVFISLGSISKSGIGESYDKFMFDLLRNCQTGFQGFDTTSHSLWWYTRALVSPHPTIHIDCLFDYSHSSGDIVLSNCDFTL